MSSRVDTCPHCGRHTESNEEFCTHCGAWLYGGPEWPAPPRSVPVPATPAQELNAEPVPLSLPDSTGPDVAGIVLRSLVVLVSIAAGVVWFVAERMIVDRDDRANWDIVWIAAAAVTLLLVAWLVVDAARRGRSLGWDHAWRLWEPPA